MLDARANPPAVTSDVPGRGLRDMSALIAGGSRLSERLMVRGVDEQVQASSRIAWTAR